MVFDQSPRENRPGMEQFPCSEMFIIVFMPVYHNSASCWENGKWHLGTVAQKYQTQTKKKT